FSLALTGNRHDAEEVAQDTFLRAYRALVTYPPDRIRELKQKPWLHRIALNVVRNHARGTRPRLVELNGSEPDHAMRAAGGMPSCSLSRRGRPAPRPGAFLRGGRRRARTARWNREVERPSRTQITER